MRVIVPCDFTTVVDNAIQYAKCVAQRDADNEFILFHVLDKSDAANGEAKENALRRLEDLCRSYQQLYDVKARPEVRCGEIFDTIPNFAEEMHADFVVMGTHGVRGLERIFGSKAIRVVISSNVPFLVVQKPPKSSNPFKRILMPLGARKEEIGKFNWAVKYAQEHGSHFHVLTEFYTDPILTSTVSGRLGLLRRTFDAAGLSYTVEQAPQGLKFQKAMQKYAQEQKIDMLFIMITQSVGGISPLLDSRDQSVLANDMELPVLCVNPAMV